MTLFSKSIITASELHEQLPAENLCLVDLRSEDAFSAGHIIGARALTPGLLNRADAPIGGLLPAADGIADIVKAIGLQADQTVVAYDAGLETAAARLVWVLHAYGHTQAVLLDGGFNAWQSQNLPTTTEIATVPASTLTLHRVADNLIESDELMARLDDPNLAILDVRSLKEFDGSDVRSARGGHVPGAQHMEWTTVFDADQQLKHKDQLLKEFAQAGATPEKEVIVYCQTHQRSAVTYVLLKELGFDNVRAIDGAWSNWGNRTDTPIQS